MRMTNEQFTALSSLLRLKNGPAKEAARLILVEGIALTEAATRAGCSPQGASNTHQRCLAGLRTARVAVGIATEKKGASHAKNK